jgi:hypothetical protein
VSHRGTASDGGIHEKAGFIDPRAAFVVWHAGCNPCAGRPAFIQMEFDQEDDGARELYSNFFKVGFNAAEFLLDFGRQFEGAEERFYIRIITGPIHAKALSRLLEISVRGYEQKFGPIADDVS